MDLLKWFEVLKRLGKTDYPNLTFRQLLIMSEIYLGRDEPTTANLFSNLGIPKAGITRAVKVLTAQGLILPHTHPADQRKTLIGRTAYGSRFMVVLDGFAK